MDVEISFYNIKPIKKINKFITDCINLIIKDEVFDFLPTNSKLSIAIVDNEKIRELNRIFRNIDKPTNVLSFVLDDQNPYCYTWGEIIISYDKVIEEAEVENISLNEKVVRLLIHSLLHLANYDHNNAIEEEKMKFYELKLFGKLKDIIV